MTEKITLIRGDTLYLTVNVKNKVNGELVDYELPEGYRMIATVRTIRPKIRTVIEKELKNTNLINITAVESENLTADAYKLIVKVILPNNDVYTLIRADLLVEDGD